MFLNSKGLFVGILHATSQGKNKTSKPSAPFRINPALSLPFDKRVNHVFERFHFHAFIPLSLQCDQHQISHSDINAS